MTAKYVYDLEQGSEAWQFARLGIPTASEFKKIITATGKPSSQAKDYMAKLLAEWYLGEPVKEFGGNFYTDRGKELEPKALQFYAFHTGRASQPCGFIYRDDNEQVGCSPDGIIGQDGLLETKCPNAGQHLMYLINDEVPSEYRMQVQGQLWVSGREWCDFMSFYPDLPPFVIRAEPDEKIQKSLDELIPAFIERMLEGREKLKKMEV